MALFCVSAAVLFGFIYVASVAYMERQTEETITAEITGFVDQYRLRGLGGLRNTIAQRAAARPDRASIYLLVDRSGRIMAGNIDRWPEGQETKEGYVRFMIETGIEGDNSVASHRALARGFLLENNARLLVGRDIESRLSIQATLLNTLMIGGGVMILLGLLGGLVMSRWMLGRLDDVNRATTRIMTGDLTQRFVDKGSGDEFDELARNLNRMLDRIERLLAGMRQVTDNVAHDLRTPLNRLRSRIEVALMGEQSDEARELLEATVRDADSLIHTFNAILSIARAESGEQQAEFEPFSLREMAQDVTELYEPLAEEKSIELRLKAPRDAMVVGNRHLVAQALANVVDNAIKYGVENGHVTVDVRERPTPALIIVDDGPGIPAEMRERALERFVRLDMERSTPGNGLGLSLVAAVARLHEAKLELDDAKPGLKISMTFPPQRRVGRQASGRQEVRSAA
ncbi:MAG TPA: HAMP domain-containing sensor histidine kinase [Geminicoccus sp.]|jgi:signal transduction histidine kinase|uniref:sensor histidine kinase n=1 Tax=Geminicoccus sp. TaxID=2024832 RepID=UPI002E2F22E3|nr:HAMP domain-containing sensor histidine kinase [Geminicoccus sp.]HEX2525134.1 HAMP domain-containing sensor histidine kinase [Geminicoccus sp.]